MKRILMVLAGILGMAFVTHAEEKTMSLYDLKVKTLAGAEKDLADYKGKVVLVVNVASKCGLTKQYTELEKLYLEYKDKGFEILAFPVNDFGGQEPGTAEEIQTFCTTKYNVTFPMFAKTSSKPGPEQGAVYAYLVPADGGPKWNFHKYLVGKDGKLITSFGSRTVPEAPEIRAAIDAALAK